MNCFIIIKQNETEKNIPFLHSMPLERTPRMTGIKKSDYYARNIIKYNLNKESFTLS